MTGATAIVLEIDPALRAAWRSISLLAAVTPANASKERARLVACLARGEAPVPSWEYRRIDVTAARRELARIAARLDDDGAPLASLYAARARELDVEAALAGAAGRPAFSALAAVRFAPFAGATASRARALAESWTAARDDEATASARASDGNEASASVLASDGDDPRSLLARMRAEVGRLRLPFRVAAHEELSSLAATGEAAIFVAAGRPVSDDTARRTVLHEVHGHALPRVRAREAELSLFAMGTARGVDEQEGLALALEQRHGFMTPSRKRELAARHLAVSAMRAGAAFPDVARALVRDHGCSALDAVLVAERAFRGADGRAPGLGREIVYLESFVRVSAHLAERPDDEACLASGQVALDALAVLRPFAAAAPRA